MERSPDTSVSILTTLQAEGLRFESLQGHGILDFSKSCRPALKQTQSPVQWVKRFFREGKATVAWNLSLII